ncbi:MAG: RNA-binding S4 domain-containing protein [Prolixibacteraceae bacterium]
MKQVEFVLDTEYIELIKLLKLMQIANSGGQAKLMVENGEVILNGILESRKRAKIRKNDVLEIFDMQIVIQ